MQAMLVGARPYFERAIAIDPTYVRAYQLRQRMYLNTNGYDSAACGLETNRTAAGDADSG